MFGAGAGPGPVLTDDDAHPAADNRPAAIDASSAKPGRAEANGGNDESRLTLEFPD
jgi:hypothetical protein